MSRYKKEPAIVPSEATIALLEPARGVSDVHSERIVEAVSRLLEMPQSEQVTAAYWMGTQPDYAGVLSYLASRAEVTGALRRAVKRALFDLRRRGVQVSPVQREQHPMESPAVSQAWVVEEAFMAAPYTSQRFAAAAQMRFFLRHTSGQKAVFTISLDLFGYLSSATLSDEQVDVLLQECLHHPFLPAYGMEPLGLRNRFVSVPIDWAVQVAHEARQRNIRYHEPIPPHAAFYWGRLPEPADPAVSYPADSLADAETGWLVSSVLISPQTDEPLWQLAPVILFYSYHPDEIAEVVAETLRELDSPLVLPQQTEEERRQRTMERIREKLYPDDRLREPLLFLLPVWSSFYLLGGERQAAVWLKAMWRELKERPDRPFHRTQIAQLFTSLSVALLMSTAGGTEPPEERQDESTTLQS
ncbi:MAG: hypothetical protein NZ749_07315 [bacterium]|nr:hypothetical protein [bacterium]